MKLPQMIRNLWIYRKVILFAVVLGIVLTFVLSNNDPVQVTFPFLGTISSRSGVVMLVSAGLGAAAVWLVMAFRHTLEDARRQEPPDQTAGEAIKPTTGPAAPISPSAGRHAMTTGPEEQKRQEGKEAGQ